MAIILANIIQKLSTVNSVNGLASGQTTLLSASRPYVITHVVVRVTAFNGVTVVPTAQVETGVGLANIFTSQALTGLAAVHDEFTFTAQNKGIVVQPGQSVLFNITAGGTGTTLTLSIDLVGYPA